MLSNYFTESFLYYYKSYVMKCNTEKERIILKPQLFYYLQPFFIYLYSISFTNKSFLFTIFALELFYASGKSGDLINKNVLVKYSNDMTSYKIMKFFNHSAFHIIFLLKLFYLKTDVSFKYLIIFCLNIFQLGMYINKSYVRRYEYIQELNNKKEEDQLILYPSYYKIPIITSNVNEIKSIINYTSFFIAKNYYFYIFGLIHYIIYFC